MKKISILIALVLLPAMLMAAPIFQIGGLVSYNKAAVDISGEDFKDIDNFSFGADIRLNPIKFISLDIPATIGFGDDLFTVGVLPSLNANIPLGSFFDIAVGMGIQMDFQKRDGDWYYNSFKMSDFADAFPYSKLLYRAAATFNLSFLSIGAVVAVPTEGDFKNFDLKPHFDNARVSAVVLVNL